MALLGATLPSIYVGGWQLLYVPPLGKTDFAGIRKTVSEKELQR